MQLFDDLQHIGIDFAVYSLIGMLVAYHYYYRKNKDLLGGFWGTAIIGTVGAILLTMLASINEAWFTRLLTWLMQPKLGEDLLFRVNLIAALLGALLFVYILNRINHDRERKP